MHAKPEANVSGLASGPHFSATRVLRHLAPELPKEVVGGSANQYGHDTGFYGLPPGNLSRASIAINVIISPRA